MPGGGGPSRPRVWPGRPGLRLVSCPIPLPALETGASVGGTLHTVGGGTIGASENADPGPTPGKMEAAARRNGEEVRHHATVAREPNAGKLMRPRLGICARSACFVGHPGFGPPTLGTEVAGDDPALSRGNPAGCYRRLRWPVLPLSAMIPRRRVALFRVGGRARQRSGRESGRLPNRPQHEGAGLTAASTGAGPGPPPRSATPRWTIMRECEGDRPREPGPSPSPRSVRRADPGLPAHRPRSRLPGAEEDLAEIFDQLPLGTRDVAAHHRRVLVPGEVGDQVLTRPDPGHVLEGIVVRVGEAVAPRLGVVAGEGSGGRGLDRLGVDPASGGVGQAEGDRQQEGGDAPGLQGGEQGGSTFPPPGRGPSPSTIVLGVIRDRMQ